MADLLSSWQAADPIFLGPGSFPVLVARCRTNFSPVRAEGASDFTSRRADQKKLLKVRSEKAPHFSCQCPFNSLLTNGQNWEPLRPAGEHAFRCTGSPPPPPNCTSLQFLAPECTAKNLLSSMNSTVPVSPYA
jgi:hypothetical protein